MKTCSYCGNHYPDEASVCAIDGQPLQPVTATPPPLPGAKKNSPFALVSFVISIAVGVLMLAVFVMAGILNARRVQQGQRYPGEAIIGLAVIFLLAADAVAVGFGIAALCQPGKKPLLGLLGLVFSSLTLLGTIGLMLIGLFYASRVAR